MSLTSLWKQVAHLFQCGRRGGKTPVNHRAPVEEAGPDTPPWPPQDILNYRVAYMAQIRARPPLAIRGTERDTRLHCLYRIYERLILDDITGYRNEIEYFWRHRGWPVAEIPDPRDEDAARYAFLACIPELLVRAFNVNIGIGLARYTPAIISPEEAEALQKTPEEDKIYENVPDWTLQVKPSEKILTIPMMTGTDLQSPMDAELDPAFLKMNIRLGAPHVLFT
jgi:hypothetical protein